MGEMGKTQRLCHFNIDASVLAIITVGVGVLFLLLYFFLLVEVGNTTLLFIGVFFVVSWIEASLTEATLSEA